MPSCGLNPVTFVHKFSLKYKFLSYSVSGLLLVIKYFHSVWLFIYLFIFTELNDVDTFFKDHFCGLFAFNVWQGQLAEKMTGKGAEREGMTRS